MELEPTNRIKMGKKAFPIPSSTDFYVVFIADTLPTPTYLPINLLLTSKVTTIRQGVFPLISVTQPIQNLKAPVKLWMQPLL
jgi:hypothetical protein